MKYLLNVFMLWLSLMTSAFPTDEFKFSMRTLKFSAVTLHNLQLNLVNLRQPQQVFTLQAEQLTLPEPISAIQIVHLTCEQLLWQQQWMQCKHGHADITLPGLNVTVPDFSFTLAPETSQLQMQAIKLPAGLLTLTATETKGIWQIALKSKNLNLVKLQTLLKKTGIKVKNGRSAFDIKLTGQANRLLEINARIDTNDLSIDTQSGFMATENLQVSNFITAQHAQDNWSWQQHSSLHNGALYVDPLYLKSHKENIELDSLGSWQAKDNLWRVDYAQWLHPDVGNCNAFGKIQPTATPWLTEATVNLHTQNLAQINKTYIQPFLLGTAIEGLDLNGQLQTQLSLNNLHLDGFHVDAQHLDLKDPKQRFALQNTNADIQWSRQTGFAKSGYMSWKQFLVYKLPLEAAKLDLQITEQQIQLVRPINIDFLGGKFAIHDFSWQNRKALTPEIHFTGALQDVSLDQLTSALKWTPLSGKVSGLIPGVRYKNNRLDLEGVVDVQVFDGNVKLAKLAVANLLSDVPKFYGEISLDKLNLSQITKKFQFGSIQGLLSGYINDLYLENWKPVSFYAWLGTPKNDTTPHKISQKAVNNIANIGGNGATDLISKSLIGMFDSFGYDELGMGCYLHQGVCQLMGVSAAPNGYYLIKGGGLPRIDVVGFNPKVDWEILIQRLGRLSSTENMVIN